MIRPRTSPPPATSSRSGSEAFDSSERRPPRQRPPRSRATTTGLVSEFDTGDMSAEFGGGWQTSTDSMMGGASTAAMAIVTGRRQAVARRAGSVRHARRRGTVPVGRRHVLSRRHANGAGRPVEVQDDCLLGARRRRHASGDGLRRTPREHPGIAAVHTRPGVARVRAAPRLVLEHRRLGPARRAILRRVEGRALSVRDR